MAPLCVHTLQSIILIFSTTSVLLTPENPSQNGASVQLTQQSNWNLHTTDINMKLKLDNSWSFDPEYITTLNLQINSNSLTDTSLVISFSQNNAKYITSLIEIDTINNDDYILNSAPHNGKQPYGEGDIEQLLSSNIFNSNNSYDLYGPYIITSTISYPLTFTLQNYPKFDSMIFSYSTPSSDPKHIIYHKMDTSQTLDIYFSVADIPDTFNITSLNITRSITSPQTDISTTMQFEQIISTQEIETEHIDHMDWFKTSLVIILVSTITILFCLCCLFGIMFTKILTNHKKMIQTKHAENTNTNATTEPTNTHTSETTTQIKTSVHVCKPDTNENKTVSNTDVPKTNVITDIVMTMTPPTMANILGDSISRSAHKENNDNNIQKDDTNIIYKTFTRDRLDNGETDEKDKKKETVPVNETEMKQENKKTDEDDSDEDMYDNKYTPDDYNILSKGSTTREIMDSDGEIENKQTDSDSSDEEQDMFCIPIREDIERITHCYNTSGVSSNLYVANSSNLCVANSSRNNLSLNLKEINSGASVAEGTTSPYASPTLQFGSPTVNSSITPYAINDCQI